MSQLKGKELVIASNNNGKILEINELLKNFKLLSLKDIGFVQTIDEPFATFEENAFIKANTIHNFCCKNVFADDSGICVEALNGLPGVDSAHFSGTRDSEENLQKLVSELSGNENRNAYYKAVICLIWDHCTYYFEGICNGKIINEKKGEGGFGYDPIFVPEGYDQTFGELPLKIKNEISHRAKAIRKMIEFLNSEATN